MSFLRFCLLALIISFFSSRVVNAESITGTWSFDSIYSGSHYHYDMTFTQQGTVITGSGGSGGTTWQIVNGTVSGSAVSWREDYDGSNYYADRTGTISGDNMSGTWGNQSQSGTWTAVRKSAGGSNGSGDGDGSGTAKRPTALKLFCNRTGVNLETAKCAVNLADAGPPPRSVPTGSVELLATNGFSPAKASCFPQQTQFSPGIASCNVEFSIPFGFPLGGKFPIDAVYSGDAKFDGSSTSHTLIQAGCIGTPTNPCSGAVAMSFADIPAIVNNIIKVVLQCGSGSLNPKTFHARLGNGSGSCLINASTGADLIDLLDDLGFDQELAGKLGDALGQQTLGNDSTLKALKDMFKDAALDKAVLDELNESNESMKRLFELYLKRQKKVNTKALRASRSRLIEFGKVVSSVKSNKSKDIKIKLNPFGRKLTTALRVAGVASIKLTINLSSERTGAVPKGVKKKVSATQSVDVVL